MAALPAGVSERGGTAGERHWETGIETQGGREGQRGGGRIRVRRGRRRPGELRCQLPRGRRRGGDLLVAAGPGRGADRRSWPPPPPEMRGRQVQQ